MSKKYHFKTRAIHAGQEPEPMTGAVMTPIFQTSTYAQEAIGKHKGYEYARTGNPTRTALELNIASLENAKRAFCFASGLAATTTLMHLFKKGDHVICTNNVYGGTYRLFVKVMQEFGLQFDFVDTNNIKLIEKKIRKETQLLFVETPTNPMLSLSDLSAIAKLAKKHSIYTLVDNTFMSPYFQNPLDFGIDMVLHSSTKYINGHSDLIGGIIASNNDYLIERLTFLQNAMGAVPGPMDCFLTLRATKTLAIRMEAHQENAMAIAEFLEENSKIKQVFYPGLKSHPDYALAKTQMRGFGGIVTFKLRSFKEVEKFVKETRLFMLAESLGGVESLICHPVSMTHASVPKEDREAFGLTDTLLRLSVGIEDKKDLINDIEQALNKIK